MKADPTSAHRFSRGVAFAFSIAAVVAGLVVPALPLVRRGAFGLALAVTILWLAALYIFFAHFAGPGFIAHLGLWFLATIGLCMPRRLARCEAKVRSLARQTPA